MKEIIEKLAELRGKSFKFNFKSNDESLFWREGKKIMNMTVLSTSALIEEIHRCGYSILEDYLTEDLISVVSKTSLTHLSSTPSDFNVFIHINVAEVEENKVSFLGEVFDEVNKVAKFEFMRIIVSKNFMERKIKEKREKIQKY